MHASVWVEGHFMKQLTCMVVGASAARFAGNGEDAGEAEQGEEVGVELAIQHAWQSSCKTSSRPTTTILTRKLHKKSEENHRKI